MQVSKSGPLKRTVFNSAFALKSLVMRVGVPRLPIVDGVAFGAVRSRLGGRVKLVISGGAPLASHVEHFLKVTMGCPVAQVLTCQMHMTLFCTLPPDIRHAQASCTLHCCHVSGIHQYDTNAFVQP